MDRFYKAFDAKAKGEGNEVDWFFTDYPGFDCYKDLHILSSEGQSIESFALSYIEANQRQYEAVITHFTELCTPFYKKLKVLTGAYIIAVDHNPRPLEGFSFKKRLKNKLKGFLYSRYVDLFVGVSPYCIDNLVKEYGYFIKKKSVVIYNGLETEKYVKKAEFGGHQKFIIACHLRKEKGVQDIISAFGLLDRSLLGHVELDIYGEGPYESTLKTMVSKYHLEDSVSFKGSVDNLHELYHRYDYLLHASHGETFCFTVVEALLSNLPVVTTHKAGNILNLIKDSENGFLFDIGDVECLVRILEGILKGENAIAVNVNEHIETSFHLNKMVEEHFKLLTCI